MVAVDDDLDQRPFASAGDWEDWLGAHHASSPGLWIRIAKKNAGVDSVRYPKAVESALCFGWIDGRREALDDRFFLQRFTPRRARSRWSRVNRETAERLIAEGRVRPAGLAQVERARADGRWETAYESQSRATVPADLQRELDSRPAAAEFFAGLDSQNRYAILYRLAEAKKPETRARRLEKFVAMLEAGERLHPPRPARS